jgi:hypothetical protein
MPNHTMDSSEDFMYELEKEIRIVNVNYKLREIYSKPAYWCKTPTKLRKIFPLYNMVNFDREHGCIMKDTMWLRAAETANF